MRGIILLDPAATVRCKKEPTGTRTQKINHTAGVVEVTT